MRLKSTSLPILTFFFFGNPIRAVLKKASWCDSF
jgi:hypothetical protein